MGCAPAKIQAYLANWVLDPEPTLCQTSFHIIAAAERTGASCSLHASLDPVYYAAEYY